jgi:hypothetical protein
MCFVEHDGYVALIQRAYGSMAQKLLIVGFLIKKLLESSHEIVWHELIVRKAFFTR